MVLGIFSPHPSCCSTDAEAGLKLKMYLFAASNCEHCKELKQKVLPEVLKSYRGTVQYEHIPTDKIENFKLLLLYEKKYCLKSDESVRIYVGPDCLAGMKIIKTDLKKTIDKALAGKIKTITPPEILRIYAKSENLTEKENLLEKRFAGLRPGLIALAGLADGINPCAFVTLVFFISVLANLKKSTREVLIIGSFFTLSVFMTYILIGFGLFRAVKAFSVNTGIAPAMNSAVAILALILAVMSFIDFIRCLRGAPARMALKLPEKFRFIINRLINTGMRRRHYIFWSLVLGFAVSLLESMCTGQIYLPIITYILQNGQTMANEALQYLALYNVMFVLPLIMVFLLTVTGMSSKTLADWFNRRLALSKLFLAIIFIILALVLLYGEWPFGFWYNHFMGIK